MPSLGLRSACTLGGSGQTTGWYHGWCRSHQVEQLLQAGPDGIFLVKNSTEFAGDLTLCLGLGGTVVSLRVRALEGGRCTIDHTQTFDSVRIYIY